MSGKDTDKYKEETKVVWSTMNHLEDVGTCANCGYRVITDYDEHDRHPCEPKCREVSDYMKGYKHGYLEGYKAKVGNEGDMTTDNMYVSKPQLVEAVQWKGDNQEEVHEFFTEAYRPYIEGGSGSGRGIKYQLRGDTKHGWELYILAGVDGAQKMVPVPESHWIVRRKGVYNDHWPVDPDYFNDKYVDADTRLGAIAQNIEEGVPRFY